LKHKLYNTPLTLMTILWVNSSANAHLNENFPLGLRGIEGVTLIASFLFHLVTPPCPLFSKEGRI